MAYLRSIDTSTSVQWSRAELERILDRYGCTRHGSDFDKAARRIVVWFAIADHPGKGAPSVPVRLEVQLADVEERIKALRKTAPKPEQVERVAWRHVVLMVEAGLVAASAGIKKVSEFFLADTLMRDDQGRELRFIAALNTQTPEWRTRLALPAGKSEP